MSVSIFKIAVILYIWLVDRYEFFNISKFTCTLDCNKTPQHIISDLVEKKEALSFQYISSVTHSLYIKHSFGGHCGRDRLVAGFKTAYAISAYHH